jgi:putative phage-type endonuclease
MQHEQQTEAWFSARLGKVTASRIADVMAKTKSGYSASRKNYQMQLLCERLTGRKEDGFTSAAMQRGVDMEPIARSAYEVDKVVMVQECGFIPCPMIEMAGASPDGLVGDDGLVEIKVPNTSTHVEFLRTGKIDSGYELQMLFQMMCTGREWCDFVSFDDRMPVELQYRCVRLEYDDDKANEILAEVATFLKELDSLESEMRAMMQRAAA